MVGLLYAPFTAGYAKNAGKAYLDVVTLTPHVYGTLLLHCLLPTIHRSNCNRSSLILQRRRLLCVSITGIQLGLHVNAGFPHTMLVDGDPFQVHRRDVWTL